jgi:GDP-L-fucose synthase
VWGTGMPMREFVHVKDFARIIESIVNTDHEYSPMIISSDTDYSIRDLVSLISNQLKFNGKIIYDLSKPDGIYKKTTSNKVFKKYFPNFQMTKIEDGLTETIDYFVSKYPNIRL